MMFARHNRTFRIGILAICLSSPVALADNEEDYNRAYELFYANQEMTDAAAIFRRLALQNYLPAQAALGDIMNYTIEYEIATGWYIMAAFQGNAHGALGLARSYQEGLGIKKDPDQAIYWYKFAAEKDNLNAINILKEAYQKGEASGLPVPVDLKQVEYWTAKSNVLSAAKVIDYKEKEAAVKKKYADEEAARKKADEEAANKSKQRTTK